MQVDDCLWSPERSRNTCVKADIMKGLGAQAFELWAVPGGGDPLVRVLYNKEELPLDGQPPGERPPFKWAHFLATQL